MQAKKPELILPAGNFECLKAAVLNGADSVYCGARKFNARIPAANFSEEELKDAIDYCHLNGKRIYLTLNTLLKDSELEEAIEIARKAFEQGIDAIICQDLGLIKALRELLPELELHASTQMTCHNSSGARFLENLGVKKIVLARELELEEIKEIKKSTKAGIECFVHGALCFSYSGQCLFSSFAFNKSGNRGQCLQPCRMNFEMSIEGEKASRKGFVLSMKDLMTVHKVKELINAGIDSFKVEGRLKGTAYVASVAKAYRLAIDSALEGKQKLSEEDVKLMKIAFLREAGNGYAFGEKEMVFPQTPMRKGVLAAKVLGFKGKAIKLKLFENLFKWDRLTAIRNDSLEEFSAVKIIQANREVQMALKGSEVLLETGEKPYLENAQELYFTSNKKLSEFTEKAMQKKGKSISYNLEVKAKAGERITAIAEFSGKKARVISGFTAEESKTSQITAEMLKERLFKSNDFFNAGKFSAEISGKVFIPVSEMKKFSREIQEALREELFSKNRKKVNAENFKAEKKKLLDFEGRSEKSKKQEIAVFAESTEQAVIAGKASDFIVCYDSMGKEGIEKVKKEFPEKTVLVKSAGIQSNEVLEEFFRNFKSEKIICSNLGALQKAIESKSKFWADRELNAFNSLTAVLLSEKGAERIIPSVECSLSQLEKIKVKERLVPLAFFYPLLMVSKAYSGEKFKKAMLSDRKGFKYKARLDGKGLLRIYNPMPVDLVFELEKLEGFNAIALDFSNSEIKEVFEELKLLEEKLAGKKPSKAFSKFTRGHYLNEIE